MASKCESFAITLLDKCTTKHEIQTLLQTKWVQTQSHFTWLTFSPVQVVSWAPRCKLQRCNPGRAQGDCSPRKVPAVVAQEMGAEGQDPLWGRHQVDQLFPSLWSLKIKQICAVPKHLRSRALQYLTSHLVLRYNIFWSEMSKVQKLGHVIKQASRRSN